MESKIRNGITSQEILPKRQSVSKRVIDALADLNDFISIGDTKATTPFGGEVYAVVYFALVEGNAAYANRAIASLDLIRKKYIEDPASVIPQEHKEPGMEFTQVLDVLQTAVEKKFKREMER